MFLRRRDRIPTAFEALLCAATALGLSIPAVAKDPSQVSALDKAAARDAMDRGNTLAAEGRHAEALAEFKKADAIMGVPTTGVLVGQAYEALGKPVEALDAYLEVGRYAHTAGEAMPDAFVQAQALAADRAVAARARIATLQLRPVGLAADVTPAISIDGEPINAASLDRRVNPGERKVVASAPGYSTVHTSVVLGEGESQTLELHFQNVKTTPAPTPEPGAEADTGTMVPAALAFSLGGAALVAGAVTGGLSLSLAGDVEDACGDHPQTCPPEQQANIDDATTLAHVSNVTFAVGGVGVVLGIVFVFVFDGGEPSASALAPAVAPVLDGDELGVRWRF
jgi:tetratricopeptide (TPR) repeat protein